MKKKIQVQTGSKKPGEHWKEVEAEVLGPFAYYEVELEPWTKGDPPRMAFSIAHVPSGTHIIKRTPAGLEPPDYYGLPSSEHFWPSEEFRSVRELPIGNGTSLAHHQSLKRRSTGLLICSLMLKER